jgi:hypothetical protein
MTTKQLEKFQLEYKNKITYLHNNIKEGEIYLINSNPHKYEGYHKGKHHAQAHIFRKEGRATPLILGREELSILDIFNDLKLKP